jgi:hypothetical protein
LTRSALERDGTRGSGGALGLLRYSGKRLLRVRDRAVDAVVGWRGLMSVVYRSGR